MEGEWLTYDQAGERLGVSPEAVRQKAIRGRWARTKGNAGKALVRLPDGWPDPVRTPSERHNKHPVRTPSVRASDANLINALQAHVDTLKAQLVAAEARIERQAADFAARDVQHAAEIAVEREKAERARNELAALADRLAALAEANQRRPWWWRRLVG